MLPLQQFLDYIERNALFTNQDKILLAVSGGKDSVLMVQLFKLSNYTFSIAHCNFNLRSDESQRDEAFVRLLAASLDVPFYVSNFDTKAYATQHQISTQMAARDLRYQWFEKIRSEGNYSFIALAHHQNDSIETLLLNLTRGTGISGMHGILPKRDYIVRPLLFLSRQQIDELIDENNINFVTDASNESTKYARNKIRLHVIPQLQGINPNLEQTFKENIQHFAETEEVLKQFVEQTRQSISRIDKSGTYFSIEKLKQLSPRKLILFELLKPFNFTNVIVNDLLGSFDKQTGTSFYSRTHRATINRDEIMISALPKSELNQQYFIHSTDEFVVIDAQRISIFYTQLTLIEDNENKAFVDLDQLIFPLIVRFRQDGDKFKPLGMKHYKKLSDFLIDNKVPLPQKNKILLLVNGNGEIIWVAGLRQDDRYKVKATTKKVAIFELLN